MKFHVRRMKYDGGKIQWVSFAVICEGSWEAVHMVTWFTQIRHRTTQEDSHRFS